MGVSSVVLWFHVAYNKEHVVVTVSPQFGKWGVKTHFFVIAFHTLEKSLDLICGSLVTMDVF